MPRGRAHPPELRASAEALLLAGHNQAEVCGITKLPKATVSGIATRLGGKLEQVRTKKAESDTDLIMGYFRAALRAMTSQAELFGDSTYTRSQNVRDLAIAHGVIGDKLAGIASTAQALGLIGPTVDYEQRSLPGDTATAASPETVDAAPGPA